MTDQEKNKIIAEWLGHAPYKQGQGGYTMLIHPPFFDYVNTNAAFDLLDELVKRGYRYNLHGNPQGLLVELFNAKGKSLVLAHDKSKSRAIVEAILALIEKEKEK